MDFKENNIEWVTGLKDEAKITLSLSSKRFINKVKRICAKFSNKISSENE